MKKVIASLLLLVALTASVSAAEVTPSVTEPPKDGNGNGVIVTDPDVKAPQTGDNSALAVVALAAGVIGIGATVAVRRRENA